MNIHTLDLLFQGLPQSIASYLIESDGELALVETGPTSTLDALLYGIRKLGFDPKDIRKVLVTHVHLDHAGSAGWWAAQGARVFVHERGAKHLIDPSKLIHGARMVYGDQLESLWGEVRPVPEERVTPLGDGDTVTIGRMTLTARDTPGHAYHHHTYAAHSIAFTGDVAGVRLPGSDYISPTTAPSQFDPEAYLKSIDGLRKARFSRLYLTHFGPVEDVDSHWDRYASIIQGVAGLVEAHRRNGASRDEIVEAFTAYNHTRALRDGCNEEIWQRYENANPSPMSADGVRLYGEKADDQLNG